MLCPLSKGGVSLLSMEKRDTLACLLPIEKHATLSPFFFNGETLSESISVLYEEEADSFFIKSGECPYIIE